VLDDRLVALATGVLGVAAAFGIVAVAHADPVSVRGAALPIGAGFVAFTGLLGALCRYWDRYGQLLVGAVVGAYAGWIALVTKGALYGTAMGYGGNYGDAHRLTAQAVKYATSWASTDVFAPNTPSDYPPFYTWLTGRASQVLGEPAWQLMQNAQVLWLSAIVVLAYALWRTMAPAPVAAVIALLTFVADNDPTKPYEVAALAATVPWLLVTMRRPARGRLPWLVAGLIGGLIFLTYNGDLVFLSVGALAIGWWAWREAGDRRAYLWYLAKVAAVAFVTASWYVVPYLWATLTRPHESFGSDTFASAVISSDPLPLHFLDATPAGVLQLVGIVGLVAYYRRAWWARPLAALLVGAYLYFGVGTIRFVGTKHTMFYHYAIAPIVLIGLSAGVLTIAETLLRYADRQLAVPARRAVAVLTLAGLVWSSLLVWRAWEPTTALGGPSPARLTSSGVSSADQAQSESGPDLSRSPYAPADPDTDAIPAALIKAAVAQRYGAAYRPMVLSEDERLFAFYDWYSYIAAGSGASPALDHWHQKAAFLRSLADAGPAPFTDAMVHAPFGPIDVVVLRWEIDDQDARTGQLVWRPTELTYQPTQFDPAVFDRVDLPNNYVVFIRRR
jgi:hypothetical protein